MEQLFEAGAKDVWFEPIFMKKNRPAVLLSVLCTPDMSERLIEIILRETSSIGVRYQTYKRIAMKRTSGQVETEYGKLTVKCCSWNGIQKCYPEYETAKQAAREHGVSLEMIYRAIYTALK